MLVPLAANFPVSQTKLYYAANAQTTYRPLQDLMMFIDPAGGGEDGVGLRCDWRPWSLHPPAHNGRATWWFQGGEHQAHPVNAFDYKIKYVRAESNMGHGLFEMNLLGELMKAAADWKRKAGALLQGGCCRGRVQYRVEGTAHHRLDGGYAAPLHRDPPGRCSMTMALRRAARGRQAQPRSGRKCPT